jgi:uncharacterized protein YbjT (DUF2867 family)
MVDEGHVVRISTRTEAGRAAIEATGAECWIGTPDRLATLRGALENVTIVCWLLGSAAGSAQALRALHGTRLEFFLSWCAAANASCACWPSATRSRRPS